MKRKSNAKTGAIEPSPDPDPNDHCKNQAISPVNLILEQFLSSYKRSWNRVSIADLIQSGLLSPGSTIAMSTRNELDVFAKVDKSGALVTTQGERYKSPSGFAAAYGSEASHSKGWMQLWYLDMEGNGMRLSTLKAQFVQMVLAARERAANGTPPPAQPTVTPPQPPTPSSIAAPCALLEKIPEEEETAAEAMLTVQQVLYATTATPPSPSPSPPLKRRPVREEPPSTRLSLSKRRRAAAFDVLIEVAIELCNTSDEETA